MLLEALKAGDQQAFTSIYHTHWEALYTVAFRGLKSEEEAKDVVHDLFLTLWQKRDSLLISTSLVAYLLTALKNRLYNQLAARQVRKNHRNDLTQPITSAEESTEQLVAQAEILSLLNTATAGMPARMREVFLLSRQDGLTTEAIAARLNLSEQTVKNQITTALKRIRGHLRDYLVTVGLVCLFFC